jgi:2-methylisocitrate lyase-like PEP mutase family enzyme
LQSYGYDEAISCLCLAYAAGADATFLDGITFREEARRAVTDLAPMPCLLNAVEHDAMSSISTGEAKDMGFKIIIFPFAALARAHSSINTSIKKLKSEGCLKTPKRMTPQALFRICGVKDDMK